MMPRKVAYHSSQFTGDPQTLFQDDKDPMLTLNPDYLDCRPDPDAAGDLGKGRGGMIFRCESEAKKKLPLTVVIIFSRWLHRSN